MHQAKDVQATKYYFSYLKQSWWLSSTMVLPVPTIYQLRKYWYEKM